MGRVQELILPIYKTDTELNKKLGEFCDVNPRTIIINKDTDAYTDKDKLLFKFRKNVIPKKIAHLPIVYMKKHLMKTTTSKRGVASGKIDIKTFPKSVARLESPKKFQSRLIYKDGSVSNYYQANKVHSMIAGFFDKPKISEKSRILRNNEIPCRLTEFSNSNKKEWEKILPLVDKVDEIYEDLLPEQYAYQSDWCDQVPDFCIGNTIFTTLTCNLNWRTALHKDSGDLTDGYSAISVASEGNWEGCYLYYPKYNVAVNVKEGDLIIKDPHEFHCNTPFKQKSDNANRLSVVYYFREGMLKCSDM